MMIGIQPYRDNVIVKNNCLQFVWFREVKTSGKTGEPKGFRLPNTAGLACNTSCNALAQMTSLLSVEVVLAHFAVSNEL